MLILAAKGVRRVLKDDNIVLLGQRHDRIHIDWIAANVDGDDHLRLVGDLFSTSLGSIFSVSGSTSANTSLQPMESGYAMVAANVMAGTITSSPGFSPVYLQAISKPAVQLVKM